FKKAYKSTRTAITPPPEVFIGVIPPSKAFPELTVEERGHIIPFFNAKIFALYNKITSIAELIGKLKVPEFKNGAMIFPLAGKLSFFSGAPGKNKFYEYFKDIERLIGACDDFLNQKIAQLQLSDMTIVSVDATNIPVDKRDKTGSIGTGSRGSFFGHKSSIAADANCIPLNETFGTGHESDSKMFPGTILPVKSLADLTGQEIWGVVADAIYSVLMVIFLIGGMNAIPFVDINPKNSGLLKKLKEKAEALKKYTKKALKNLPREEKIKWRKWVSDISKSSTSAIPLEQKKKRLKSILRRVGSLAMRKGLSLGERQSAKRLRRELMDIRREIRFHGTIYEKIIGLGAIAHGTIEWLLVYSIRGQNDGINGILKKRGDVIGDGQHSTWQLGNLNLSRHVSMAQVGLKFMVLVKFIVTGQENHHLRWVHNWRRKKRFFCRVIFIIFSRENLVKF
ncbi:MAG: transposase, partial [Promethearchaeota archaeon]